MKKKSSKKKKAVFKKKAVRIAVSIAAVLILVTGAAFILRLADTSITEDTYPLKYEKEISAASEKYGVDIALIYGVIKTESDFDPEAKSGAGAIGLMQLMPETFEWMQAYYKEENDYTFEDLYDPELNIDYGVETLSILLDKYESEETAICAYNGGLGNVDKWLEDEKYSDDGINLKVVPFPETDNYRKLVEQNKSIYKRLYFS